MSELASHRFGFVVGAHVSGTSIMHSILAAHEQVSAFHDTGVSENEGQHLQDVYSSDKPIGKPFAWALSPEANMDEHHTLATAATRLRLYRCWRPYWDLTKPVLLEKSPRHTTMTRFLQSLFHETHTFFIVITRHPLGASEGHYRNRECGRQFLRHWVAMHNKLIVDLPFLKNAVVVQYEHLMLGDTQRLFDGILSAVHLSPPHVPLNITVASKETYPRAQRVRQLRKPSPPPPAGGPGRRQLMYLRGDRNHVEVLKGMEFHWVDEFNAYFESLDAKARSVCTELFDEYEAEVRRFGYSLKNMTAIVRPPAFAAKYVQTA